ncbi:MAG: hypothetical protein HYT16_03260 [DPANN group archaeon]|nr:hypothetical protein [DPANN group archaeon]
MPKPRQPNLKSYLELQDPPLSASVLEMLYKCFVLDDMLKDVLEGGGVREGLEEYGPVKHGRIQYTYAYVGAVGAGSVAVLFPEKPSNKLKLLLKGHVGPHELDHLLMRIVARAQTTGLMNLANELDVHSSPGD